MLFPAFWFAPLAKLFDDVPVRAPPAPAAPGRGPAAGVTAAPGAAGATGASGAAVAVGAAAAGTGSAHPLPPSMIEVDPPGPWSTRVLGRSVMLFPAFWFAPLAKLFDDVPVRAPPAPAAPGRGPAAGVTAPPGAAGVTGASGAAVAVGAAPAGAGSMPKQIEVFPPGP